MKTTIEMASELRKGNVKNIFNAIDGRVEMGMNGKKEFEYSDIADTIIEMVAKYATGFVVDIAKRFGLFGELDGREMSEKQRWCVAFAFQKLTDENVAAYTEFCKEFCEKCEKEGIC